MYESGGSFSGHGRNILSKDYFCEKTEPHPSYYSRPGITRRIWNEKVIQLLFSLIGKLSDSLPDSLISAGTLITVLVPPAVM
jgi:hypothetical protein